MAKQKRQELKSKKQESRVQELQRQLEELNDKYARALADYQNLQKRTHQEKTQFAKISNASLLTQLLPVLDNLEAAAAHISDSGLDMILDQFRSILETEGVSIIDPEGQTFDPQTMECVETIPGEPNRVMTVDQKGYQLGDTILRPAKVIVGNDYKTKDNN